MSQQPALTPLEPSPTSTELTPAPEHPYVLRHDPIENAKVLERYRQGGTTWERLAELRADPTFSLTEEDYADLRQALGIRD